MLPVMSAPSALRDATVLVSNLHPRFAGVSATILALVPLQQREREVAVLDLGRLGLRGTVGLWDLLRWGWRTPVRGRARIWHARRSMDLVVGLFLKKVLRQPWKLVFTSPTPRRHGAFLRGMIHRCDAIIAVSEGAASFLDWHTAIVPHGVDTEAFHPSADKSRAWAEGGLPGEFGIGMFGRIRPSKGTDLFVEALCRALPERPGFSAILTGLCKPSEAGFRAELEARIRSAGLVERIRFLGDLSADEVKVWYRRVSLCVAPSRTEGFGLTPLEAMASGAAALTSRSGYFPHMIRPGVNGDIVETGSVEALYEALMKLLEDPQRLQEMGKRARDYVVQNHSIEHEVAGIHAVYDGLGIPGAPARPGGSGAALSSDDRAVS